MPRITLATLVKLLVACLVVGAVMSWLGFTPQEFWLGVRDFAVDAVESAERWVGSVLGYVLIGAVVVVPIWLARYVWLAVRRRS
jgi:hypothetical protein